MEILRRWFPQSILLPLGVVAALTYYAWADLGWIGIAVVVAVSITSIPALVRELRKERVEGRND
jgi:hypothetical protein